MQRLQIFDPKPRVISVPPFRDRVVHQCLCAVLAPRVERRLIRHNFACRVGQGSRAAMRVARAWARTYRWHVRLDVQRFFPTVDHAVLLGQIAKDVPEDELRGVCERIVAAGAEAGAGFYIPGDDLFTPVGRTVDLPLGDLTSQLWANRFLDPIDHLVKDRLRLRAYLRYMDGMLLMHDDRRTLESVARSVEEGCHALRLRLHPWSVQPTMAGVGFVGYRILRDHVRVRRSTVALAERSLAGQLREGLTLADDEFREGLRSTMAHWDHADACPRRKPHATLRSARRRAYRPSSGHFRAFPDDSVGHRHRGHGGDCYTSAAVRGNAQCCR